MSLRVTKHFWGTSSSHIRPLPPWPKVEIAGGLPPLEIENLPPLTVEGETLVEQLTQDDAVNGVLTFSEPIRFIEIFNTDQANDGVFIVNGIEIVVPKNEVYKSGVGGTPSPIVSVSGSTTYIVGRYA